MLVLSRPASSPSGASHGALQARRARRTAAALVLGALGVVALLAVAVYQAPSRDPAGPALLAAVTPVAAPSDSLPATALLPPLTGFVSREFDAALDHWGVDLAVPENTAVASPADGVVVLADETTTGGKTVVLQHAHGLTTVFKHNVRLLVRTGERVRAGNIVALSGNTGEYTTGPHLHYEVWQDGEPVDPKPFLAPW